MSIIILDWCGQASLSLMKIYKLIVWLFIYSLIYVPLKNVSFIWIRRPCRWRATKLSLMLVVKGLRAGRDLCRATTTLKRDLDFSGLTRRIAPFSRLLRHTRGYDGSILTRILSGMRDASGNCLPCYISIVGNCFLKIRIWVKLLRKK